jgi:GDP-L-fucose synthase
MSKKVLVTGANGFLGTAVIKKLSEETKYDILPANGKAKWDLTNKKYVDCMLAHYQPDIVVHLAARVGGIQANKENPGLFFYENLIMGVNLIEACRQYDKLENFIMVGTVCAYPKFTTVPFNENDIWNGFPEETNAPYGIAKKALMQMLIAYKQQYNFNCVNLIPVNMYGPNDNFDPKISHVIPALILKYKRAIVKKEDVVEIWGTGNASREFLYVDDCAEAIVKSITANVSPEPINIGTGNEINIRDLASLIGKEMGYTGSIQFNSNFPDGQPRRCLDTNRAKSLLGFQAKTSFMDGIKYTVEWFNQNEARFNDYINNF